MTSVLAKEKKQSKSGHDPGNWLGMQGVELRILFVACIQYGSEGE